MSDVTTNSSSEFVRVEMAKGRTCRCGCGATIIIKPRHKNLGIPEFIHGHCSRVKNPMTGRKASEETRDKMSAARKGNPFTEAHKQKISEALKGRILAPKSLFKKGNTVHSGMAHSDETKKKMSLSAKGRIKSPETCRRIGEGHKGMVHSEAARMKMSLARKGRKKTEAHKEKIRIAHKELWVKNPDHSTKMSEAWNVKPNKPETVILNLLNKLYPGEWKYTGDFSFTINGKNPDFVNCNGQKKVIELYGDYWHEGDDPQDRIDLFAPFGFETLVIWERELKDIGKVEETIRAFHEAK